MLIKLQDLDVSISTAELISEMVPPKEFQAVSFTNYIPDDGYASQARALQRCSEFVLSSNARNKAVLGVYLDGGFGVGKTHLLASIYRASTRKKLFSPFLGVTSAIGYLGFAEAVKTFSKYELLCIDEFELDDPGDTMVMSRFLKELANNGVTFAATSNTPPNAYLASLHQSKFAKLAEQFDVLLLSDVRTIEDQFEAVRLVSFVDRAYEAGIALRFSGDSLGEVFRADHVSGAYQKKYRRALSRMAAMCSRTIS